MKMDDKLVEELAANEQFVQILSYDDLLKEWEHRKSQIKTAASYYSAAGDLNTARKLLQEFGVKTNQVIIKQYMGKSYVIFKGYPGLRQIFRGTRYMTTNPKVVRMAIGPKGIIKSAKGGFIITVVLSVGIEVFDYFIKDEASLAHLFGTVTSDIVKIGLSSIAGAAAGLAVGSVAVIGSIAGAPLIAAIAVGIVVGLALDAIDKKYGATKALIDAYEKLGTDLKDMEYEFNRTYNWLEANPCAIMQMFGVPNACSGY